MPRVQRHPSQPRRAHQLRAVRNDGHLQARSRAVVPNTKHHPHQQAPRSRGSRDSFGSCGPRPASGSARAARATRSNPKFLAKMRNGGNGKVRAFFERHNVVRRGTLALRISSACPPK